MLKVVWNIFKSVLSVIFSIFRPLRRLICRRRKLSESDGSELTSIGTGNMIPVPYNQGEDDAEIEMEEWDSWDVQSPANAAYKQSPPGYPDNQSNAHMGSHMAAGQQAINGFGVPKAGQTYNYNQKQQQQLEPEPEIDFFEDMTPDVKKQRKILIRKKESSPAGNTTPLSSRLAVMSDVPFSNSELQAWEDQSNAWDSCEAAEDLTWQAEEAIREKRRKERMERQMEQQKKKQKKDEMRGFKSGSLIATKLS